MDKDLCRTFIRRVVHKLGRLAWSKVAENPALGAKLLRVHYHDCFVRGCDASILLDTVGTVQSEKDARPNLSLSGFDVIDDIKTQLKKPLWDVLTGRRDGTVSLASDVNGNLPSPASDFTTPAIICQETPRRQ
ncbi:Peroxidase [Thalictrum thalictroides]|uniref:Peroxidase n=1 Tax=Thalictrum thalictroides TaxID=46969 RepID=A0A7J6WAH2_THATH|nr:Peroxidase [Thalictrum thalictroides]